MHGCRVVRERVNLKSGEDDIANHCSIILKLFDEAQFSENIRLNRRPEADRLVVGQASPSAVATTSLKESSLIFTRRVRGGAGGVRRSVGIVSSLSPRRRCSFFHRGEGDGATAVAANPNNSLIQFDSNFSQFTNKR
jgi:hypothetical protein